MTSQTPQRPPNRLIRETSPYLLQHAYNPVDWYPWGPEALRLASEQNKPILLSIGYSACHWCHVMERESFENEAIAVVMNRNFICIKVDREERPDLDEIYMAATVTLNRGQGGWPMTVFLTPDQQPFFAGTYFPPDDRWGRPGFLSLLKKIAEVWQKDAQGLKEQARDLTERLKNEAHVPLPASVSETTIDDAVHEYRSEFDAQYGGFGSAPKFPPAAGLSLLLRCYRRSGDSTTLHMVTTTLNAMAAGGIYDHIGGGFARYSTDERWLVPHFEKMLYDNALLAKVYLEAFQVTGHDAYRRTVEEVLDYVRREMTDERGGFFSSTDADSEGVEGKFFVWTPAEIRAALDNDEDARRFCAYYDITEQGNWEHRSIPNRLRPIEQIARDLNLTVDELQETIQRVRPLVYQARTRRVPPGLDDKIVTAWNGMMISAFAEAGRVLNIPRYVDAAERAADFLLDVHRTPSGQLLRTSRKARAHLSAVLEDYAYLGEGLVDLYEACGEDRYLAAARRLADHVLHAFRDHERGGFFTTSSEHESLILRAREGADGATPGGNAVAAMLLARLSFHDDRRDYRDAATDAIRAYGKQIARFPRAFAKSLAVVDLLTEGPVELGFVGSGSETDLCNAARGIYLPNRIIARTPLKDGTAGHPLLAGRPAVDGKPTLYICRNFSCRQPITDPQEAEKALASHPAARNGATPPARLSGRTLAGIATAEGTARYASKRIAQSSRPTGLAGGFGPLGSTGLTSSKLGFGCYRIDAGNPDYAQALASALREGVNVIDTSTNYMDGESERLVGAVLRESVETGAVARDEIILVSKIGYVQGENLKQAQRREQAGRPYPDMVKYGEGLWHCIHPEFLADQLTSSLDRLSLETLDVCLLHNPEYFLSEASRGDGADLARLRDAFYARIEQAFAYLETQVEAGRIRWYGVSSNHVAGEPSDPEATSLTGFMEAAARAAASRGQNRAHFAVLQCPMNLFESFPFLARADGTAQAATVLDQAASLGIAVLVNRPLNAMPAKGTGMLRLAEFPVEGAQPNIDPRLAAVRSLEEEYRKTLAPSIPHGGQGTAPADFFDWASELARVRPHLQGLEHWEHIEHQMIAPHVNQVFQAVPRLITGTVAEQWEAWRERYVPELLALLAGIRQEAALKSRERAQRVADAINPYLPHDKRKESLSRKALWVLASTPGVSCVLNGMRSLSYVEDSTGILSWERLSDVRPIYEAVRRSAQDTGDPQAGGG